MIKLLQVQQTGNIQRGAEILFQYGILGVFTILLLYWFWYAEKLRRTREQESNKRIESLEKRFNDYQEHDRVRLEDLIEENTSVMKEVINELRKK